MNLPRGIPTPPDATANERAHRLDAEAEAFMRQHAAGIIDAWYRTGDPAAYGLWDNDAVRKHWPELWTRWRAMHQAKDRLAALVINERQRRAVP